MSTTSAKSVVFITGAFFGQNCWDEWIMHFERQGYACIAPSWPSKFGAPEQLRNQHPDANIASNRLESLIHYFATIIYALPYPPVIIGHSLGGLVLQLLLQRGLGSAGIAIHSFPVLNSIPLKFSAIKMCWECMDIFSSTHKSYMISFKKWKNEFANGMTCERQKDSFYKYATPESKLIIRDTLKCVGEINFTKPHAPLLFTSGGYDQFIPAEMNYKNYLDYKKGPSTTEYMHFRYHNHLVFENFVCREQADFIIRWLQALT